MDNRTRALLRQLLEDYQKNRIDMYGFIFSPLMPEVVLHHFACDCAERAVDLEAEIFGKNMGIERKGLRVKRMWADGKVSEHQRLQVAGKLIDKNAFCDRLWNHVMRPSGKYAAWYTAQKTKKTVAELTFGYRVRSLLDRIRVNEATNFIHVGPSGFDFSGLGSREELETEESCWQRKHLIKLVSRYIKIDEKAQQACVNWTDTTESLLFEI